jgi:hypothetical protein
MANISQINGFEIYASTAGFAAEAAEASTASLAQSANTVLVDREGFSGPQYLTYVSQSNPSGVYTSLYNNESVYISGSTLVAPNMRAVFTGSLLGTASLASTASYISPTFISASAAASGFGSGGGSAGGTNLGLVYAVSLGYLMP